MTMINDNYVILDVYTLVIPIIILMMLFMTQLLYRFSFFCSFSALLQNYLDHTTATIWLLMRVALLPTETILATALESQC